MHYVYCTLQLNVCAVRTLRRLRQPNLWVCLIVILRIRADSPFWVQES